MQDRHNGRIQACAYSSDLWHLHGVKWDGGFYFFVRLVFGCRSSPKIFDKLSSAVCWILQNNYGIRFLLHLLDDFLTIDASVLEATRSMAVLIHVFSKLQIPLAPHKTVGPTQSLEFLGITLDASNLQARLPEDKKLRIGLLLTKFCTKKCTKRDLLSLLGHLNFASGVIPAGRAFVTHLLSVAKATRRQHHFVSLAASSRRELRLWGEFLTEWNGIALFPEEDAKEAASFGILLGHTSVGCRGSFDSEFFECFWPDELQSQMAGRHAESLQELYPIVLAAVLWGQKWGRKKLVFSCTDPQTLRGLCKGRSPIRNLMPLLRRLTWCALHGSFSVTAQQFSCVADSSFLLQDTQHRHLPPCDGLFRVACPPFHSVTMP